MPALAWLMNLGFAGTEGEVVDANGWIEITVGIIPALTVSVMTQRALEMSVTAQPALEITTELNP